MKNIRIEKRGINYYVVIADTEGEHKKGR